MSGQRLPRSLCVMVLACLPVFALAQGAVGKGNSRMEPVVAMPGPLGVTAESTPFGVQLSWQTVPAAVQYLIFRAPNATTPGTQAGAVPAGTLVYIDRGFNALASYQVVAVAGDGRRGMSARVDYTPAAFKPVALADAGASRLNPVSTIVPSGSWATSRAKMPGAQEVFVDESFAVPVRTLDVYRQNFANGPWVLLNAAPLAAGARFIDVTPTNASMTYRVIAHTTDGRDLASDAKAAASIPITAQTQAYLQIRSATDYALIWLQVPGAIGVRVFGAGMPPQGQVFTAQPADWNPNARLPGAPLSAAGTPLAGPGTHHGMPPRGEPVCPCPWGARSWRSAGVRGVPAGASLSIVPEYEGPVPNLPRVPLPIAVSEHARRYRVAITGFRVDHPTIDDPLQLDGKGDEVYVAAIAWHEYNDANLSFLESEKVLKTAVFGDVNGQSGRIQAGSASGQGGLVTGDVVPPGAASVTTAAGASDRFPLTVFEGVLSESDDAIIVMPAIWESDRNAQSYAYWLSISQKYYANPTWRSQYPPPPAARLWTIFSACGLYGQTPGVDRPVGIGTDLSPGCGPGGFTSGALYLTQKIMDASLPQGSGPARTVMSVGFQDASGRGDGQYTLYIQLERLP